VRGQGAEESYRPDVDGLRAIAVLAVILFHVDERLLPGGFVGVDVFFVISGFLITGNVLRAGGGFSLAEFYRRRIRRISLPMLAVTGVVVAAAQVLLLPADATRVARSGLWSSFSLANVYFWKFLDRSYFAPDSRQEPLLHLWSLGVEEQFYLVWPLLLTLGSRRRLSSSTASWSTGDAHVGGIVLPRPHVALLVGIAALSFALADSRIGSDRAFVFYMLPTRAWELVAGALAAIAVASGRVGEAPRRLAGIATAVGLAMIAAALAELGPKDPFPGRLALAPVLGAVLVLLGGHAAPNPVSRMLSVGPLVAIGLVSYSAYLWHWPLLAFYRYGYGEVDRNAGVLIVALTFLLAWASWRWIETPARRSVAPPLRVFLWQFAIPAAVVGLLAASAIGTGGFGPRMLSRPYRHRLAALEAEARVARDMTHACNVKRITDRWMADPRCVFGPKDAPVAALLWGDSQAMHYVGMMEAFAAAGGFRFRQVDAWACAPIEGDPTGFVGRAEDCRKSSETVLRDVSKYPVVVMAGLWPAYGKKPFLERSIDLARRLAAAGHRVVLLGRTPAFPNFDLPCEQKALGFPWKTCRKDETVALDRRIQSANARLAKFAAATPGVEYFDANDFLCGSDGRCRAFDDRGRPRYFDQNHLSLPGSRRLGESVIRERGLPAPFRGIPEKAASWRAAQRRSVSPLARPSPRPG